MGESCQEYNEKPGLQEFHLLPPVQPPNLYFSGGSVIAITDQSEHRPHLAVNFGDIVRGQMRKPLLHPRRHRQHTRAHRPQHAAIERSLGITGR